ncbi:MAG: 4Fe-4S binding protein [Anaerolineae bacterium]
MDFEKCTYCGRCAEVCQYHAIAVVGERVPLVEALPGYTAAFRELYSKIEHTPGQTGLGVRSIPSD